MHFVFALYKYFPWGGLQKDTLRFATEAVRRGHTATIFTTQWESPQPPAGIHVEVVHCSGWSNHGKMLDFQKKFQAFLQTHQVDASLAMNRVTGADFYFVADTCLAKYMPQKHHPLLLKLLPRYRAYLQQEAEICSPTSPTTLMCIAQDQVDQYQDAYHLPAERVPLLPPGMDPRSVRPQNAEEIRTAKRKELGISAPQLVLITVGTNLLRKGVDRAMESIAYLKEKGLNVRYLLAGGDRPADVQTMARKYHIEDCCTHLHNRDDVPQLLLAADLMLHPAREEGTGTVLVEAIAAGIPVICSKVCGFSTYVKAATDTVTPEPFQIQSQNTLLEHALANLTELTQQTRDYSKTQDFCSRAIVGIQLMEAKGIQRRKVN